MPKLCIWIGLEVPGVLTTGPMLSPGPSRAYPGPEETGANPETVPAIGVNLIFGALTIGGGLGGGNAGVFRASVSDTILSDSLTACRKPGTNKISSELIVAAIKTPIAKRFLYAFRSLSFLIMSYESYVNP